MKLLKNKNKIEERIKPTGLKHKVYKIIKNMDPGLVKNISEKLNNSYSPEFLKWLKPTITYNPSYKWNLNIIDDSTTTATEITTTTTTTNNNGFNNK